MFDLRGVNHVRYSDRIRQAIETSGLSLQDVADRCEAAGVKIDRTYLSKIRNNACKPPMGRVNRIIAEVLGLDPKEMEVQAYIERAPEEVRHRLVSVS